MEQESKATQAAAELQPAETGSVQSGLADGTPAPGGAPAPAGPSLKEEFRAAESDLTDAERARLKTVQQELIGKFLVIGCVWGMVIGALISRFLLGGTLLNGVYSGVVVGMILGVFAGILFGALEKAMLLQHIGKYARQPGRDDGAPKE